MNKKVSTEKEIFVKYNDLFSWSNSSRHKTLRDAIHEAYEAGHPKAGGGCCAGNSCPNVTRDIDNAKSQSNNTSDLMMNTKKLYLTSMCRVVLDNGKYAESFAEPYDIVLFTEAELERGIKYSKFMERLQDAFIEQSLRDREQKRKPK